MSRGGCDLLVDVDTNPNEVLRITHEGFEDSEPGVVTRKQFEAVWEPKGWTVVDADDSNPAPIPRPASPALGGAKPNDTKDGDS